MTPGRGLRCRGLQGIVYQFDTLDDLTTALEASGDEQDLALPCQEGVREGEWLLVTMAIGDDATSVAGRVCDRGGELRVRFEWRDWEQLQRFARGDGPLSIPPPCRIAVPESISAPIGATALLVDTDASVLSIVRAMLGACGVATQTAYGAEEAFDMLRRRLFDLVVLEPALDGMNGLELCRRLRSDARLSTLPILVLTSHTSDSDVRQALRAGADDFVGKPFRAHELRARAIGLLQRARATQVAERPA